MTAPDSQIITRALELLKAGLLPSNLPERLMAEFGITPKRARRLAGVALRKVQDATLRKAKSRNR